jgi:hypothetical protein
MPDEFSDTTEFREPTIGAKLCIDGELPSGYTFESAGDNMVPHEASSTSWDFVGPFIGGQAIRARWFKPR